MGGEGRRAALHRPAALHAGQARVLQVPAGRAGPSHPRPTPGPPPVPPRAVLKTPERATPRFPSEASGMAVPSPLSRLWRACASALPARRTQRLFRGHCFGDRRPHGPGTEVPSRPRQGPAGRPASPSLCRPAPQRSFGGLVRPHVMHEFMNALEILARTWRLVIVANEEWPSGRSGGRVPILLVARGKQAGLRGLWLFFSRGWFWGYEETRGLNVSCLSVQGSASVVAPVLLRNTSAR